MEQPFPADGLRAAEVVTMRVGRPGDGPVTFASDVCADCLADLAVGAELLKAYGSPLAPFIEAGDGKWHQVTGTLP